MLRPCQAVRCRTVLWAESDANKRIPHRKNYIINWQNRLNAPGYIARAWAHYNTFRGAPFPREMSQNEVLIGQNQSAKPNSNAPRAVATVVPVNDTQTQCTKMWMCLKQHFERVGDRMIFWWCLLVYQRPFKVHVFGIGHPLWISWCFWYPLHWRHLDIFPHHKRALQTPKAGVSKIDWTTSICLGFEVSHPCTRVGAPWSMGANQRSLSCKGQIECNGGMGDSH